jgi:hypothetical protein
VTTLTPDQLVALLRASSAGSYGTEAAAQLLCGHRSLLGRPDLLAACVEYDHDGATPDAWVSWDAIPAYINRAALSSSETNILRLVAELAGTDTGVPLDALLSGLDDGNAHLVLDALAHALRFHHREGRR